MNIIISCDIPTREEREKETVGGGEKGNIGEREERAGEMIEGGEG